MSDDHGTSPSTSPAGEALVNLLRQTYLLVDFVSGRPDRNLNTLTITDPTPPSPAIQDSPTPAAGSGTRPDWKSAQILRSLAEIHFNRDDTDRDYATDAAVLLIANDALSRLASPARATTIAYTAMYVQAEAKLGWIMRAWRRLERAIQRRPKSDPSAGGGASTDGTADKATTPSGPRIGASTVSVAELAFPHFQDHVRRFCHFRRFMFWLAIPVLWLTVQTSWDVAHGRAVVQRLDEVAKQRATALQTNPLLLMTCPEYQGQTFNDLLKTPAPDWAKDPKIAAPCLQWWLLGEHEAEARSDLNHIFRCDGFWCNPFVHVLRWGWILCSGTQLLEPSAPPAGTTPKEGNIGWQSATSVLTVFTGYVLPMLYGLLGTIIGAFRGIQQKVRDSLLAPRDFGLTLLGLPLGAVAGIVVGLFFAPSGTPIQGVGGGISGDLTLTAGGLGFLAGYGSQSFFEFVDHLIQKVFLVDPSGQPAAANNNR